MEYGHGRGMPMHGGPPPFSGGAGPGPGPMMMMPPAHLQQQQYELPGLRIGGGQDGGMTYELSLPPSLGGNPFASVTLYPFNVPMPAYHHPSSSAAAPSLHHGPFKPPRRPTSAAPGSTSAGYRETLARPSEDAIRRRRSASVMSIDGTGGGADPGPPLLERIALSRLGQQQPYRPSSRASQRSNYGDHRHRPYSSMSNRTDGTARTVNDGYYPKYAPGSHNRVPVGEYKSLPADMKRAWFSEAPEERPAAIVVHNLQMGTTAEDLQSVFCEYGNLKSAELLTPDIQNSTTSALIIFDNRSDADLAVDKMNGCTADGNNLVVERIDPSTLLRPHMHSTKRSERVEGNPVGDVTEGGSLAATGTTTASTIPTIAEQEEGETV